MSNFAPLQHKSARTTSPVRQRIPFLPLSHEVEQSNTALNTKPGASSDRQNAPDFSLANIPIDPPVQTSHNGLEERRENHTGLPDKLKAGIESLSGMSLDDVRVHYNSPKPARMRAWAYTQGTDIHIGPRQEKHLPHEAWHVVQQKQGRVQPMLQARDLTINDDKALESEASVMGEHAVRHDEREIAPMQESVSSFLPARSRVARPFSIAKRLSSAHPVQNVIQGMFWELTADGKYIWHWGPVINWFWTATGKEYKEPGNWRAYGVYKRKSTQRSSPPASPTDTSSLDTAPSNSTLLPRDLPQEGEETDKKESSNNTNISPPLSPSFRNNNNNNNNSSSSPPLSPRSGKSNNPWLNNNNNNNNNNSSSSSSSSSSYENNDNNNNNNNNNDTSALPSSSYEQPWKQYEKKKWEGKSNRESTKKKFDFKDQSTWVMQPPVFEDGVKQKEVNGVILSKTDEMNYNNICDGIATTNASTGGAVIGQCYHMHMVNNGGGGLAFYYRIKKGTENQVEPVIYAVATNRNGNNYVWKHDHKESNSHPNPKHKR